MAPKQTGLNPFAKLWHEGLGFQFSPDDKSILVETKYLELNWYGLPFSDGIIALADSGAMTPIPFKNIKSSFWLSNDRIFFKYQYGLVSPLIASYSQRTGVVETRKDSMTYFNLPSPDLSMLAFATSKSQGTQIWIHNFANKQSKPIAFEHGGIVIPVSWAPNGKKLVLQEHAGELKRYYVHDLETGKQVLIPIFNSALCGWDSAKLYLRTLEYRLPEDIYEFDTDTGKIRVLFEKIKELEDAYYSAKSGEWLLIIKNQGYLRRQNEGYQPRKILDDVIRAVWSNDGKRIAFVPKKKKELFVYDITNGRVRQVTKLHDQ